MTCAELLAKLVAESIPADMRLLAEQDPEPLADPDVPGRPVDPWAAWVGLRGGLAADYTRRYGRT